MRALLAMMFWAVSCSAAFANVGWNAVSAVDPGSRLHIDSHSGDAVDGRMIAVTDEVVTIKKGNKVIDVQRSAISRVQLVGGPDVRRHTRRGFRTGAGVGGTMGLLVGRGNPLFAVFGVIEGAMFGTLIGLFNGFQSTNHLTIYLAPPSITTTRGATPIRSPASIGERRLGS